MEKEEKKEGTKTRKGEKIVTSSRDLSITNTWHWIEWDAKEWMEERAKEIFKNGTRLYESKKIRIESEHLQWIKGDACVTNRKLKIGAMYEIQLGISFKGIYKPNGAEYYGIIEIPNLQDEKDPDDFDVIIIRAEGIKDIWLKKKTRYRKLKKLITQLINELKAGGCFTERVNETIEEMQDKLKKENEKRFVGGGLIKDPQEKK